VGFVVWRDKAHLPKELIFELHYLGSVEYSFSLNFSRPAAHVIAQYFNFVHLGFEGYRTIALNDLANARLLSRALENSGYYTVLSDIHRPAPNVQSSVKHAIGVDSNVENYMAGLPVVSFRFTDEFQERYPEIQQRWIQTLLRAKGWIVPNYELAPNLQNVQILRVVVRDSMTATLVENLVSDIIEITESLMEKDSPAHALSALEYAFGNTEQKRGTLDEGTGSESNGTYAKPC